ncbi:aspartic proteinase-like protein 2 isoform X2 [Brachypodium distachyon]|uniref:aspartic proteinase-like protein 2 isoform X2 n=1 Tax=Brachypodium distachyon TaxID=15368 RepID=UPI00071C5EE2|nr:aspartic proteinase-like protein 2 isoform X2 [Brachypodium distachyon]|eukprot:XP_014758886.1 aspartic proteinase-like protein 2 isoform X2 [Brachypodium distachyon]
MIPLIQNSEEKPSSNASLRSHPLSPPPPTAYLLPRLKMQKMTKLAAIVAAAALLLAVLGGAAAAPAPAMTLERRPSLKGLGVEELSELDRKRFAAKKQQGVTGFVLEAMPGLYCITVKLGNPSRHYYLAFHTGSDVMWVPCSSCTDCPTPDDIGFSLDLYDPKNSSTSSEISCSDDRCADALKTGHAICHTSHSSGDQCGYNQIYADGVLATTGYYVSDDIHFDIFMGNESFASSSASVIFGCSKSRSGHLQADGVIGFGKDAPSLISQLNSQGVSHAFSRCLDDSDDGGGVLILDEVGEPGLEFTSLVASRPCYNLNMKSIAVNNQNVPIDSSLFTTSSTQGTFLDSGTSLAYFPDGVYDPVIRAIHDAVPYSIHTFIHMGSRCFIFANRSFSSFPTVTIF